jgi:hypothetical protein
MKCSIRNTQEYKKLFQIHKNIAQADLDYSRMYMEGEQLPSIYSIVMDKINSILLPRLESADIDPNDKDYKPLKPWFEYNRVHKRVEVLTSPKEKINTKNKRAVAKSMTNSLNKEFEKQFPGIGVVFQAEHFDNEDRHFIRIAVAPTNLNSISNNLFKSDLRPLLQLKKLEEQKPIVDSKGQIKLLQKNEITTNTSIESINENLNSFFRNKSLDSNNYIVGENLESIKNELAQVDNTLKAELTSSGIGIFDSNDVRQIPSITTNDLKVSADFKALKSLMDNLSKRFGIQYEFDANLDAKGRYNPETNTISLNPNLASLDTPIHEFAHPFILLIKKNYPQLYNALINEASNAVDIVARKSKYYPELTREQLMEEVLAEIIGLSAKDIYANNKTKNLLQKMWDFISNLLGSVNGINKQINSLSSIRDVAEYFVATSSTLDMSDSSQFINPEDMAAMNQANEEQIADFQNSVDEALLSKERVSAMFESIFNDLKIKIKATDSAIRNKRASGQNVAKLRAKLQEQIKLMDMLKQVDSIAHVMVDFSKDVDSRYFDYMNNIEPKLKDFSSLSAVEKDRLVSKISLFNNYVQNQSVWKDILNNFELRLIFNKQSKADNPLLMLDNAISKLKRMEESLINANRQAIYEAVFKDEVEEISESKQAAIDDLQFRIDRDIALRKELIAKSLTDNSSSLKNKINKISDRIAKSEEQLKLINTDKEGVLDLLAMGRSDIDGINAATMPAISSPDLIISGFAKFVYKVFSQLRDLLISEERQFGQAYKKFTDKNGLSSTSTEEFESFIEIIDKPIYEEDENGERKVVGYRKIKSFIQQTDFPKYYSEMRKMYESVKELTPAKRKKAIAIWYSQNTEPKPINEINQIIADKKEELRLEMITEQDYQDWINSVVYEDQFGNKSYRKELSRPKSDKYTSAKWKSLNLPQNAHKKEFYDFLISKYASYQSKLPRQHRKGFELPSVDKGFNARVVEDGTISTIKDLATNFTKYQARDQQYGSTSPSGQAVKEVPIYFTQNMDAKDVSSDLLSSVMLFGKMSLEYEAKSSILPEVNIITNVLKERKYQDTNSKGQGIVDRVAASVGFQRTRVKSEDGGYNSTKQLIDFLDNTIFGITKNKEEFQGIAVDKVIDQMMGWQALSSLGGFRPLKATANYLQATLMNRTEAAAKEYLDSSNIKAGRNFYNKHLKSIMGDMMNKKLVGKSLPTQLIEYFDAIQGNFTDEFGRNISGNLSKKFAKGDLMFLAQNLSEHAAQGEMFFGMLDAQKVNQTINGQTKQISLLEAFELGSDGNLKLKEGVEFSDKSKVDLEMRVHALSKRLYGVYNSFDRPSIQKHALGRATMMFRKFLVPGLKRRFKNVGYDYELDGLTEGYYVAFWKFFNQGIRDYSFNLVKMYDTLSPIEKKNILRATKELTLIAISTMLALVASAYTDDDDEKEYIKSQSLVAQKSIYGLEYLLTRLGTEMRTYMNPIDFLRIAKNPAVITSYLERLMKLVGQAVPPYTLEEYKRDYGMWEKGDLKVMARFLALFGITGNEWNPEYATQNIKRFL